MSKYEPTVYDVVVGSHYAKGMFQKVLEFFMCGRSLIFTMEDIIEDINEGFADKNETLILHVITDMISMRYIKYAPVPDHVKDKDLVFYELNLENKYVQKFVEIFDMALHDSLQKLIDKHEKKE